MGASIVRRFFTYSAVGLCAAASLTYVQCSADDSSTANPTDGGNGIPDGTIKNASDSSPSEPSDAVASDSPSGPSDASSDSSSPWTPASLSNLVLWLDSTQVEADGGVVTRWPDRSSFANNAFPPVDGGTAPTLAAASLGGNPAVHFDGLTSLLDLAADAGSLEWGTSDYLVAVVARHTTPTDAAAPDYNGNGYGFFFMKQAVNVSPFYGPTIYGGHTHGTIGLFTQTACCSTSAYVTSNDSGVYNDGVARLITARRYADPDAGDAAVATLELRVNGAPIGSVTSTEVAHDVSAIGYPAHVGGSYNHQNIQGDMAEVVAVKGAISPSDLASLESYLRGKYGL
jgi:hypothetical protein